MKNKIHHPYTSQAGFWEDESGMGTVEVILIIVVLIGLVIIFKKQITGIVNNLFTAITNKSNEAIADP